MLIKFLRETMRRKILRMIRHYKKHKPNYEGQMDLLNGTFTFSLKNDLC